MAKLLFTSTSLVGLPLAEKEPLVMESTGVTAWPVHSEDEFLWETAPARLRVCGTPTDTKLLVNG